MNRKWPLINLVFSTHFPLCVCSSINVPVEYTSQSEETISPHVVMFIWIKLKLFIDGSNTYITI